MRRSLLSLALILCSNFPVVPRKEPHAPPGYVSPELQAYVDDFFFDCAKACPPRETLNLSIQSNYGPMVYGGTPITGLSLIYFTLRGIRRVIYVRTDDRGPATVKATVYHELMHSVFFASHVSRAYREIPAWSLLDEWDAGYEEFYAGNWESLARTDFCRLTDQYRGVPCKLLKP